MQFFNPFGEIVDEILKEPHAKPAVANFGSVQANIGAECKIERFAIDTSDGRLKCIKVVGTQDAISTEETEHDLFPPFMTSRSVSEMPDGCSRIAVPDSDLFPDVPCEHGSIVLILAGPNEQVYVRSPKGCGFLRSIIVG